MYGDYMQLYLPVSVEIYEETNSNVRVEECMSEMRAWLAPNNLKLNDAKREVWVIGQKTLCKGY